MEQATPATTANPQTSASEAASTERKIGIASYALMLAMPILGITPFIAVILSYVSRGGADPMVKTHHSNIIKTFWVGLLFSIVAAVAYFAAFVIMMAGGPFGLTLVISLAVLALTVWIYIRMIKGIIRLVKNQPWG